jgi:CO/xanthine dehydrogenase Mo-binding subunit
MENSTKVSRRVFLKLLASGATVSLSVTGLSSWALDSDEPELISRPEWAPEPGKARWRIDGMDKVLGKKIYARDFKARDIKGWPQEENFLYALRCDRYDQIVTSYDLSMLSADLQPLFIVNAEALAENKIKLPADMNSPFFAQRGRAADFFGQPVALLIFANFDVYRRAVKILQFNPDVIQYGAKFNHNNTTYNTTYKPTSNFVRDDEENFNYVYSKDYDERVDEVAKSIKKKMVNNTWPTFSRSFYTQTIDPMFMEPESGMAWYDVKSSQLNLVLGTQSPLTDITHCASIFDASAFPVKNIDLLSCYPGGGFGGRDASYFPLYLAVASAFTNKPLRWMQNRFEQFQVGIKRCETNFSETLAIDHNGKIQAIDCNFVMNGGGQKNLSPYVAQLAALISTNCYDIPRAVATANAMHTPQLLGGSQRGFGAPQACIAIETLLDEAAQKLNIDPFTLRRKNLLSKNTGATVTGAPVLQDLQLMEMMEKLEHHPLWKNRFETQQNKKQQGLLYGVGFALSNDSYGTSVDGMYGGIQINDNGSLTVFTTYVDMGNGAATALGLAPASYLGRNANNIEMGVTTIFDALNLTTQSSTPLSSHYVLKGSASASASRGAFHQFHVIEQAGLVLLLQSLFPAANALWNSTQPASALKWKDNHLYANNLPPLSWSSLLQEARRRHLPMAAVVHASFAVQFATAQYGFTSGVATLPVDYIAIGKNIKQLSALERSNLINPPAIYSRFQTTRYAPCGSLVAASLDPKTGKVSISDVVSVLCAGVQHCPEMVSGQSQGAVAMTISNVLFEQCPNNEKGPGNGTWNLHQYKIAHMADIPRQELIVLDPAPGETTARGIGEAVMCPLAPSILNALAMATSGKRFNTMPVTAELILESIK